MRLFFLIGVLFFSSAASAGKLQIVTSFSILEDMAKQIGGDRVEVTSLVGRNNDMHAYEPKPADVKLLRHADVFVVNGLGLEGFITRLVESSGFKGDIVEATHGITAIKAAEEEEENHEHHHHHEEHAVFDPHAWQSLKNGMIYARNIATAFAAKDPHNKNYYNERLKGYLLRMEEMNAWAMAEFRKIPPQKRSIVIPHDSFGYFARDYGIRVFALQGLSTGAEPSAEEIARIIDTIRKQNAGAVFVENIAFSPFITQVTAETGAHIGGQLFSDALSEKSGKAYTYLEFFHANVEAIISALR